MEKIIAEKDDRIIIYDSEKKVYKKYIKADFRKKLRMFFGLKRCHGKNAYYLSNFLRKNGINTYEVISYTKDSYTTKEIIGKSLKDKIIEVKQDKAQVTNYLDRYMKIIRKILDLNLYYTDFHLWNFLVNENDEIYLIDIDEMHDSWYYGVLKKKRILIKLKRTLKMMEDTLKKENIDFNAEKMYEKYIIKK